jgi:hypothetical protein
MAPYDGSLHLGGAFRMKPGALRSPGVSIDITEGKKRDEVLIRTEKLAAVDKLAASIAHEINNPLESVMKRRNAT